MSKIIKVCQSNPDNKIVGITSEFLNSGQFVVLPTDTVYGICIQAEAENAIKKLSVIKGRPANRGIPLIIGQYGQLFKFINQISVKKIKFLESIWPGPVTFIFETKNLFEFGENGIAIRLPEQRLCRNIATYAGPFFATSANKNGKPILDNIEEIHSQFKKEIKLFLDGGTISQNKASTIVSLKKDVPELIRKGSFSFKKIIQMWEKI